MLMKLASKVCSLFNDARVSLNFQKHREGSVILTIRK